MAKAVVVRYQTRADAAEGNQRLIGQVFAELSAEDPGEVRYAAFRLADGVNFVQVALFDRGGQPTVVVEGVRGLPGRGGRRRAGPPVVREATLIGSYRFAEE